MRKLFQIERGGMRVKSHEDHVKRFKEEESRIKIQVEGLHQDLSKVKEELASFEVLFKIKDLRSDYSG